MHDAKKKRKPRRTWKMLLTAEIGLDTAENEPPQNLTLLPVKWAELWELGARLDTGVALAHLRVVRDVPRLNTRNPVAVNVWGVTEI